MNPQDNPITPEMIKEAARFSNFCMWFKSKVWERMKGNQLPESALDEIAQLLWEREKALLTQEIMGYPVIINPDIPKDEIWFGTESAKIIVHQFDKPKAAEKNQEE